MRTRSPRIAPPLKGLLGSIASTPTSSPDPRTRPMSLSVSVDLPEPGAPVIPTVYAPPVLRYRRPTASVAASPPASTSEISTVAATGGVDERGRIVERCYSEITSVIPGTRSMMIRSTPALRVIIDTGHVPHAPTSVTWTALSASMPLKTMSPPSLWSAGRMASMASRTPASRSSVSVSMSVGMCSPLGRSDPAPGPTLLFSHAFPGREEPHSSSGGGRDAPDVGAEGLELTGEIGITAIDVVRVEDAGLAVGGEPGDHEGGAGAHVLGAHGCAGE